MVTSKGGGGNGDMQGRGEGVVKLREREGVVRSKGGGREREQ